jgi:hypothetical protein
MRKSIEEFIGAEVIIALAVKRFICLDVTPCSPVKVNGRFGESYHLQISGSKSKVNNKPA